MPEASAESSAPDSESIRAELARVLASATFAQSEQLKQFLRYVVERRIDGRGDDIKEYRVGVEVFGRDERYDPRVDPIVRVQASRLRSKLADYYQKEGESNPVWIALPRGAYAPAFSLRGLPLAPGARFGPSRYVLLLAAAALLTAGILIYALRRPAAPPLDRSRPALGTIAVLPFVDMSPEGDRGYFCDGMAEALTDTLNRLPGLRVVPRTTAFQFKGRAVDVRTIGREMEADLLVQGSVRLAGDKLRVAAQFLVAEDGRQIWSGSFDRPSREVFAVQDEIAQAIANALKVKIGKLVGTPKPGAPLVARPADLEAYTLYLKARYALALGTEEGILKAIEFFERAGEVDPKYARAYAGLAEAYAQLMFLGLSDARATRQEVKAAVEKALALDGELTEALVADAAYRMMYEWDWTGAERELRRAIQLGPESAIARAWYGMLLAAMGRQDEALEQARRATELEPLSLPAASLAGACLYLKRDFESAVRESEKLIALAPDYYFPYVILGRANAQRARFESAISTFQKLSSLTGRHPVAVASLASTYAAWGRKEETQKLLGELEELAELQYVSPILFVRVHLALGESERALSLLEKAARDHVLPVVWLKGDPEFDAVRSHPRFVAILKTANLAE